MRNETYLSLIDFLRQRIKSGLDPEFLNLDSTLHIFCMGGGVLYIYSVWGGGAAWVINFNHFVEKIPILTFSTANKQVWHYIFGAPFHFDSREEEEEVCARNSLDDFEVTCL